MKYQDGRQSDTLPSMANTEPSHQEDAPSVSSSYSNLPFQDTSDLTKAYNERIGYDQLVAEQKRHMIL